MGDGIIMIDDDFLNILELNKGIFAFGYFDNSKVGYPLCYPKFAVDVGERSITFIENNVEVIESLKISNWVSISVFDWFGSTTKSFQLKGLATVFSKGTEYFSEVIERLETRTMKPEFLNRLVDKMDEKLIIPKKEFVVLIDLKMKYSQAPSPESAKPVISI